MFAEHSIPSFPSHQMILVGMTYFYNVGGNSGVSLNFRFWLNLPLHTKKSSLAEWNNFSLLNATALGSGDILSSPYFISVPFYLIQMIYFSLSFVPLQVEIFRCRLKSRFLQFHVQTGLFYFPFFKLRFTGTRLGKNGLQSLNSDFRGPFSTSH